MKSAEKRSWPVTGFGRITELPASHTRIRRQLACERSATGALAGELAYRQPAGIVPAERGSISRD